MSVLLTSWNRIVSEKGNQIAITVFPDDRKVTFKELDSAADLCRMTYLREISNLSGVIIGLKTESRESWLVRFLAILKAGCIVLPVDTTSVPEEVDRLLASTGTNAWFNENHFVRLTEKAHLQLKRAGIQIFKITSGSTSLPKVIAFTESQMVADATNILETKGLQETDIQFATIPLGHSYGLGSLVYPFFLKGIPLVFNSIPLPGIISKELNATQATVMPTIPAILNALAKSDGVVLPSSLRLVISAASPLTGDLIERFEKHHALRIHNFYGSSETGGIAYDSTGKLLSDLGAVGSPMNNVEISISKTGRVQVASAAVFTYKNRRKAGNKGICLLTDFGSFENGALKLRGRSNRIVKHNGKRIDLSQVEKTLLEHADIREVFVTYDEKRHRIEAAVAGTISNDAFVQFAQQHLSVWKRPKVVWFSHELPTTVRGKPDQNSILAGIQKSGVLIRYS